MQLTTTNSFDYTPTRMAKMKSSDNIKYGQDHGAADPPTTAGESANWYNYSGKLFGSYLPKLNMHLCYDIAIPLPTETSVRGTKSTEMNILINFSVTAKIWKQLRHHQE